MDGVVLSRMVEVGALVAPGQQVIAVAETRTLKATFAVPQTLVEKLQPGSPVRVFVGGEGETRAPEKMIDAKVTRIAPAADTRGRVFAVEASISNEAGALRAGSVVSVHVPEAHGDARIAIPLSAVVRSPRDNNGFAVFVLQNDRARLEDVSLGEVLGNAVTVTGGLTAGQRVVTVGSTLLRDGDETVVIH
jgi:RND family efflux transporter MFP subunit